MSDPIDTGGGVVGLEVKPYSLKKTKETAKKDLKALSVAELLVLRDEIDLLLPPLSLKSFNAEQEVLLQYLRVKDLQNIISVDESTPANQRAQVANTVNRALSDITKLRNEIYNTEQFRLMEAALAKTLKTLPPEAQEVFFKAYGKQAEDMADAGA